MGICPTALILYSNSLIKFVKKTNLLNHQIYSSLQRKHLKVNLFLKNYLKTFNLDFLFY